MSRLALEADLEIVSLEASLIFTQDASGLLMNYRGKSLTMTNIKAMLSVKNAIPKNVIISTPIRLYFNDKKLASFVNTKLSIHNYWLAMKIVMKAIF